MAAVICSIPVEASCRRFEMSAEELTCSLMEVFMLSDRVVMVLIALFVELMTSFACFVLRLFFFTSS